MFKLFVSKYLSGVHYKQAFKPFFKMLNAIFNFKPYILWLIPIESKDTSLQQFFISFLFMTKDPWRKCSKLFINRKQLTVHVLIPLFTFHLLHVW